MELKLHYAIDPLVRRTRYQVDAYFFVPHTLGIDAESYGREAFFSDVQAYIRFKTPTRPLTMLARDDVPGSQLAKVKEALAGGERELLSRELRMLACLFRASIREVTRALERRLVELDQHEPSPEHVGAITRGVVELSAEASRIVGTFRDLGPRFEHAERPWLRELFEYTDEALSVAVESLLTGLLKVLDRSGLQERLAEARAALVAQVVGEQDHRRRRGYLTVLGASRGDGAFIHRQGMLKKFVSSVLFLELAKEREAQHVAQLIAATAAGAAMLVSTVLAIWSQQVYGINTFPFVVALVLGYMLKDRMKDWMRSYFSAKIGRWLYDRSAKIMDPLTGVMVGRCRESFNFVPAGQVPSLVWRRRHVRAEGAVETEHKRESVMRYVKHITLAGRRIDRQVVRASDITDIVRFDVSRFLVRMDDRKQRIPIYDPETDSVRTAKLNKRYHVNVVLVLRAADRNVLQMERYRFVLDKSGLKELQQDDEEGTVIIHAPDRSLLHILAAQRA
ncbi:MAG: hypothetical protein H6712_32035 [Myxococcales bacterium]|nr:hypothetical protein [Myxococcales bacterium]MCB9718524.1 hypothetical protein [Myxococcales bacterium]